MKSKLLVCAYVLFSSLLNASGLEIVPHFGGGSVYVRRGSTWYSGSSLWNLKPDVSLERVRQIHFGAELCAWTAEDEVRCAESKLDLFKPERSRNLGRVPSNTKKFHGYCLETTDGEIFCLQSFIDGNDLRYHYARVDTEALGPLQTISASATHVCVQTLWGKIFCWGENYGGKLGRGGFPFFQRPEEGGDWSVTYATAGIPFPTKAVGNGETNFTSLSVYANTSCALSDGPRDNLYCWGRLLDTSNLYMDFSLFSQTTSSQPRRLDLSVVPSGRLVGLVTGPLVGFGHDELGRIYFWGEYAEPLPTAQRLELRARILADPPPNFSISHLVPVQGEVCAVGTLEAGGEALYCSRRPWDRPSARPELVPVDLP